MREEEKLGFLGAGFSNLILFAALSFSSNLNLSALHRWAGREDQRSNCPTSSLQDILVQKISKKKQFTRLSKFFVVFRKRICTLADEKR